MTARQKRERVLDALIDRPGQTAAELADATGLGDLAVVACLVSLELDGLATSRRELRTTTGAGRLVRAWFPRPK